MSPNLLAFIAWYGAYFAFLHIVPGPWQRWTKGATFDNWTYTHVLWGAIAKRMGVTTTELATLTLVNEGIEALLRKHKPELLFGTPEDLDNVWLDFGVTMAAYWATPPKKK